MKQIISASYKDDTPAFKSEQFFEDLKKGFRILPTKAGPMRISLKPEDVHCFVFWTKNPSDHFLNHLDEIQSPWYIQWTISGYGNEMETNLPPKKTVVERFAETARRFGKEHLTWRYDPILISDRYIYKTGTHKRAFDWLAEHLSPHTDTCVISFFDEYKKLSDKIRNGEMRAPTLSEINTLAEHMSKTASRFGLKIQTCSEGQFDLTRFGISEGPCIDPDRIEALSGETLPDSIRTPNSFRRCQCAINTDIGTYHTCKHGCRYCYAK